MNATEHQLIIVGLTMMLVVQGLMAGYMFIVHDVPDWLAVFGVLTAVTLTSALLSIVLRRRPTP